MNVLHWYLIIFALKIKYSKKCYSHCLVISVLPENTLIYVYTKIKLLVIGRYINQNIHDIHISHIQQFFPEKKQRFKPTSLQFSCLYTGSVYIFVCKIFHTRESFIDLSACIKRLCPCENFRLLMCSWRPTKFRPVHHSSLMLLKTTVPLKAICRQGC